MTPWGSIAMAVVMGAIAAESFAQTIQGTATLTARIDCNRGRGTWKATGANQLELGPLALTRAACPEGSLHDQIVKQWTFVRSFVLEDGHLFLSLMADGGIYELEPRAGKDPPLALVAGRQAR